ncbi:MAG: sulfotransferase [Aquabacterium sp.]|nr:sulfotransferase [Aquabacterium sp.]
MSARRLVAVWLTCQRESVCAGQDAEDWPPEAGLPSGDGHALLLGMMLCLLGAHRQALSLLQVAVVPPWASGIVLAWRARATQHLGDHAGARQLWAEVQAQPAQTLRERRLCCDDAGRARAALVCGDLDAAQALAERLVTSISLEPAGRAIQLQCLVQAGRDAEAVALVRSWALSARSADSTWAALHALVWLGQEDAIDAGWADACNRLDAPEMQRLDLRMPELLALVGRRAAAARMLHRRAAAAGGSMPAQARLALLLARSDHHDADVLQQADAAGRATAAEPGENRAGALCAQGLVQRQLGDVAAAQRFFRQACTLARGWWLPRWELGELLLHQGLVAEGIDHLSHAVELAALAHGLVVPALRPLPDDAVLHAALAQRLAAGPLAPELRQCLLKALGAATLRQGKQHAALAWLDAAADVPAGPGQAWRPSAHRAWVDDVLATFTRQRVDSWSGWGCASMAPVFVVGLPLSGQAAVQAVLGGLPGLHVLDDACMVAEEIGRLAQQDRGYGIVRPYPACVDEIAPEDAARIAGRWLQALALAAPAAQRFVDSDNRAEHVGFIKLIFPRARIVWCRREPQALALALHADERLPRIGRLAWLGRLHWIGAQWVDQERLMAHWQRLYGDDVLPVPLEGLHDDAAGWAAALAAHLGLPGEGLTAASVLALPCRPQPLPADMSGPQLARLAQALRCVPVPPLPRPLPELPPGLLHRARRALETGQPLRAELDLRRLLDVMPAHAAAHYHLGQALARREQPLQAWVALRSSIALQPHQPSWRRALLQTQHAVLAAGLAHAFLLLAGPQPDRAAPLVAALNALQQASPGTAPQPADITPQDALQQAMQALVRTSLPAWPVLRTLHDLQLQGQLSAHRRLACIAVPVLQMEAVTCRLQRLGLALRTIDAAGGRLLIWPAHQFSLILVPSLAADTDLEPVNMGALPCLVPTSALLSLNRLDLIVDGPLWQHCEALQAWLAAPMPASPQAVGAAASDLAPADAAVAALQAWLP